MGLDQYAYRVKRQNIRDDFDFERGEIITATEKIDTLGNNMDFAYWRKFHPLDNWMRTLYMAKGGKGGFNCNPIRLEEEDLDNLYADAQYIDFYEGGYCGTAQEEKEYEYSYLMKFIKEAKKAIAEGDAIYYNNWW